jgi:hypothetical protein
MGPKCSDYLCRREFRINKPMVNKILFVDEALLLIEDRSIAIGHR